MGLLPVCRPDKPLRCRARREPGFLRITQRCLCAMLLVHIQVCAQHIKAPEKKQSAWDQMRATLLLDEDQYVRIKNIYTEFNKEISALVSDTLRRSNPLQMAVNRKLEARNMMIRGVLTPEQMTKWRAQRAKIPLLKTAEGQKAMRTAIGLSASQSSRVADIEKQAAGDLRKAGHDSTLTREQRHEAIRNTMAARHGALRAVLTETQYVAYVVYEAEDAQRQRTFGAKERSEALKPDR